MLFWNSCWICTFVLFSHEQLKKRHFASSKTIQNHKKQWKAIQKLRVLRIPKNSFCCYFDTLWDVFSIKNTSNEPILVPRRSQKDAQNGSKERPGRSYWMTGRHFSLDFCLLKQAGLIFSDVFVRNWFLIAFCQKNTEK